MFGGIFHDFPHQAGKRAVTELVRLGPTYVTRSISGFLHRCATVVRAGHGVIIQWIPMVHSCFPTLS